MPCSEGLSNETVILPHAMHVALSAMEIVLEANVQRRADDKVHALMEWRRRKVRVVKRGAGGVFGDVCRTLLRGNHRATLSKRLVSSNHKRAFGLSTGNP